VLSLFFARGAGQSGTTARILAGQYLGFAGILVAAILVTIGAGAFLPPAAIPYFGLIPLGIGLWAAWEAWRGDDDDEAKVSGKKVGVGTVAGVTFANGGDNIGVYTPFFSFALQFGPGAVEYCLWWVVVDSAVRGGVVDRHPSADPGVCFAQRGEGFRIVRPGFQGVWTFSTPKSSRCCAVVSSNTVVSIE